MGLLVSRSGHHCTPLTINGLIIFNPWLIQNIRKATKKQKCHSERQNAYKTAIGVDDPRTRRLSIEDNVNATARPFNQEDCFGLRAPRNDEFSRYCEHHNDDLALNHEYHTKYTQLLHDSGSSNYLPCLNEITKVFTYAPNTGYSYR